ncbi:MAG: hypothetical protein LBJ48_06715 [Coriobacteriales bacterium]|jgi:hypothetical protein|nr:hypothetical protein [Coriobacteriales bacterium]
MMNDSNESNAPQLPSSSQDDLGAGYLIAALVDYLLLAICGFFAFLIGAFFPWFFSVPRAHPDEPFFSSYVPLLIASVVSTFLVFILVIILYFCVRRNKLRGLSWTGPVIRRLVVFLAVVLLTAFIFFQLF